MGTAATSASPRDTGRANGAGPLRRLVLVRAGDAGVDREQVLVGKVDPPLSGAGEDQMRALARHWEYAERVLTSPLHRARASADLLSGEHPVVLDPRLRAPDFGEWEGRAPEDVRESDPEGFRAWQSDDASFRFPRGESLSELRARVDDLLASLREGPEHSLLLVSHRDVIRGLVEALGLDPLPAGRPWVGEMVLTTRDADGTWRLGRRTSDPESLRNPLEREGLSGRGAFEPERHVAHLELA